MDSQVDSAQRRAEAIACEIHFLNIEHITERPRHCDDGYDGGCGGRDGECDVIKTANIVQKAMAETRRAALEEASIAVKKLFDEAQPQSAAYYTACLDIDLALDRLREGVEG